MVIGNTLIRPLKDTHDVTELKNDQAETAGQVCSPEDCDTFLFMSRRLGMNVLHPGGLEATSLMTRACKISKEALVLDAGCGQGSTARFLAEEYGCRVVGVDVDTDALLKAQRRAQAEGMSRVAYRYADLNDLPFDEETFDGAIAQAVLIFTDKRRVLRQISQKIKKGGFVGVLELAWILQPTASMVEKVQRVLCQAAVNAETHEGWMRLLDESGVSIEHAEIRQVKFGMSQMLRNEGIGSTVRIALQSVFDGATRKKIGEIDRLFSEMHEYLGYGMYVGRKSNQY